MRRAGSHDSGLEGPSSTSRARNKRRGRSRVKGVAFEESFSPVGGWGSLDKGFEGVGLKSTGFEDAKGHPGGWGSPDEGVGFKNAGFEDGRGGDFEYGDSGHFPRELQETRIGAVGVANSHSATEASAHMY